MSLLKKMIQEACDKIEQKDDFCGTNKVTKKPKGVADSLLLGQNSGLDCLNAKLEDLLKHEKHRGCTHECTHDD